MTESEAIEKLRAYHKCQRLQVKGIYEDCNVNLCDNCDLTYAQGTTGEHIKSIEIAIQALKKQIPMKPVNYNEFDEQMVEWLEELSRRRVEELFRKTDEKVIRDNAIDEFADKIISLCVDGEFMKRFNEFPATTTFEIAEQLKES